MNFSILPFSFARKQGKSGVITRGLDSFVKIEPAITRLSTEAPYICRRNDD
jgi:hypothetical protein